MSREHLRKRGPADSGWYAESYHPIITGSIDGTDTIPHDKALVRAIKSRYKLRQTKDTTQDPRKTLFVGRLNRNTTEETLYNAFKKFGEIKKLHLVRNRVTKQSRGYCFIEYMHDQAFREAYYKMHNQILDNCQILVDYERERIMKGWKPRRLGGGLGGKKESGQLRFGGRDRPFKQPFHVQHVVRAIESALSSDL